MQRKGARSEGVTSATMYAAWLAFLLLFCASSSAAQTYTAQGTAGAGGVATRGYGGGAIVFANPAPSYLAPQSSSAAFPATTAPLGNDTLIITSHGNYRYGSQSPGFVPRPAVQSLANPPLPPLLSAPPPPNLGTSVGAAPQTSSPAASRVAQTAPAAGTPPTTSGAYGQGTFSEARIGLSLHDIGAFSGSDEDGLDVDLQLLFGSPVFLSVIGSPRPHIGGKINTAGDTSYGFLGLTWDWLVRNWFIVEASFGSAIHDGELDDDAEKDLGCRALLHGSLSAGILFAERHKVLLTFDHATNASLCGDYQSLDGIGLRYGILF